MRFLQRFPSSQAVAALQRMEVARRQSHYLACAREGQTALYAVLRWEPLGRGKQDRIRQAVARAPLARIKGPGGLDVGDLVPPSTPLQGFPSDMLSQTPEVTAYRFVLDHGAILVVEPANMLVVQKIASGP